MVITKNRNYSNVQEFYLDAVVTVREVSWVTAVSHHLLKASVISGTA